MSGPYQYGLLLIGGLLLVCTAFFLFMVPILHLTSKKTEKHGFSSHWYNDFIGLIGICICFYVAWGFGLPALRPLNLGIVRIVFQVIFIVATIILGLLMILFYCFMAQQVRELFCKPVYELNDDYTFNETPSHAMTLSEKNEELLLRSSIGEVSLLPPDYDFLLQAEAEQGDIGPDTKDELEEVFGKTEF